MWFLWGLRGAGRAPPLNPDRWGRWGRDLTASGPLQPISNVWGADGVRKTKRILIGYGRDDEHVPGSYTRSSFALNGRRLTRSCSGNPFRVWGEETTPDFDELPSGLSLRVEDNRPKTRPVVRPGLGECRGVRVSGWDARPMSPLDGTD